MNIQFIKTPEKRRILEQLNKQFGIENLNFLLIKSAKEKIRGFSGQLSKEEICQLSEIANIEVIGAYMLRIEHDLRLSFDATKLLSQEIKKNIIEIDEEQMKTWMQGFDLPIQKPSGTYVIKYQNLFLGCGKSNGQVILNHVPKDRRLRK
jgi:NOL1/NOP2/fmu family ribosome biogenesis protein